MKIHGKTKAVETYRGVDIMLVNYYTSISIYYSVSICGELSSIALASVQACKNVIDTYIRSQKL